MLAMHKSGTAGRDITCCGVEAPRWPASRCCKGRFAGVTRLVIMTGESASRVPISMADPAGSSASGCREVEITASGCRLMKHRRSLRPPLTSGRSVIVVEPTSPPMHQTASGAGRQWP